ncbi:MAG: hypothetical protein ACI9CO_002488, partial [Candidatus Azotimanducaceae bacterium]
MAVATYAFIADLSILIIAYLTHKMMGLKRQYFAVNELTL